MTICKKVIAVVISVAMTLAMIPFISVPASAEGEFIKVSDGSGLHFDAKNCPAKVVYEASDSIAEAKSSNEKVFVVNRELPYKIYTEQDPDSNYWDLGSDGKCEIFPMGEGTATLTLKNNEGKTITETVTVEKDYFRAFLDSTLINDEGPGIYHSKIDPSGEEYDYIDNTIGYGENSLIIYSRYGTKVTVKYKGKTYKKESMHDGLAFFTISKKLYKLNTKGKFTIEFGPASITKTFKVVSRSRIEPRYIKPKASSGKVKVYKIHKGDYLMIKAGKRTVKKVKFKKAKSSTTVKFYKYKMKRNTKIKAYLYNKFKQKMAKMNYKVGKPVFEE